VRGTCALIEEADMARSTQRLTKLAEREDPIAPPAPSLPPTSRERIDTWLRIDLVDDPFVVDWAPPQH
jgi:hypothetical protein